MYRILQEPEFFSTVDELEHSYKNDEITVSNVHGKNNYLVL